MQHPVTTEYEEARQQVDETLYAVKDIGLPVLWFWPNVDAGSDGTSKGIRVFREREKPEQLPPVPQHVPGGLPAAAASTATAIVGNSSVAIRECSFLGVPAVNIGIAPAGTRARRQRDRRGPRPRGDRRARSASTCAAAGHRADHLYGDGHAGARIADCLATAPLTVEKRLTY